MNKNLTPAPELKNWIEFGFTPEEAHDMLDLRKAKIEAMTDEEVELMIESFSDLEVI
jgi:hypothetical protein